MLRIENEHDRFYSSVAKYYHSIFPLNPAQVECLTNELGTLEGKSFLDVGCGSGNLAAAIASRGALVTAIDLNDALLSEALVRNNHQNIIYRKANMLHIARLFGRARFDGVICFGNTLVHLLNPMQMRDFFSGVRSVLKPEGSFFLQILNYDHVFAQKIQELPEIENDTTRFERKYQFVTGSREIRFGTRLLIKATGEVIENETDLLGIGKADLLQLMDVAGFTDIRVFGDFGKTADTGNQLPLVCICRKTS